MQYTSFGLGRMAVILRNEHWPVNRKAVQRHMREMGIAGITPGPNPSQRSQAHRVYPYLLRGMKIESKSSNGHRHHIYPDGQWLDVLVAVLDWYTRRGQV
ncbi:hypothetical protein CVV65_05800 [Kyrpidia spormannii]|uniref:HTH-like domain-containing protein n=1 Tax=Kyrpidia spormannii TaxID=2055160 RepID=A0A2K8N5C3_9BACL|nr:hypothetical protein CVV65_05800 [Kyrpidia spormannii]